MEEKTLDFWSFIDHAVTHAAEEVPGLDEDAMRMVITLHRVTSMVVYDLESAVHRPRGSSWPGFRMMFALWLAGPLEARRVAELSGISRASVSALTKTLVAKRWVTRSGASYDGRTAVLALTPAGRAAVSEAFAEHNRREREWASALEPDEVETLTRLLAKLMASAQRRDIRRRT